MQAIVSDKLVGFLEQANILLAQAKKNKTPFSVSQVRENLNKLAVFITKGPDLALVKNDSFTLPDRKISIRIYSPAPQEKLPVVLHFHGGGHLCGSIDLYDDISRKVAQSGHCIVIAVDYRLAPEHPYPDGLNDCEYALMHYQQLLTNIAHNEQVMVLGDSAGGAICTTLAMKSLTNKQLKIDKQILIYPSVDYTMESESIKSNGTGFLLESSKIAWYFEQYFSNLKDRQSASPLFGNISKDLPPTLIFTAGCDPLRDEGLAYAGALTAAGVPVQHHHFKTLIHAYMLLESLIAAECEQTYQLIGEFIKE